MKTSYLLTLLSLTMLMISCNTSKPNMGYVKIKQSISRDSADRFKKNIIAISPDSFAAFHYTNKSATIGYRLLSPPKNKQAKKYPLVLVLHSSGTPIGIDNIKQLGVLAKLWAMPDIRKKYPAYVLAPQFPIRSSNYIPMEHSNILTSAPDPILTMALQLLDSLKQVLPIDQERIYVIGFSMGASSTINSLGIRPDLFAGAVAISGIPEFAQFNIIAQTPVWFIHGNADTENPIASDSLLYHQLEAAKAKQYRFWEIDQLEHEVYPALYMTDVLPKWLFKQRKKS